ncbi:MAG: N-ethylmaleimide reductase [Blastocatellia bacterium]|jgi:N-ethylmaleimide reductase|nr:N-ethylmaleimide reductase [Blastocatellia bacterium]
MTTLFDPLRVGNLELDNRIIMAPMTRSRASDDGIQPPYAAEYYSQRASAGLIISEATNISPLAKGYVRTPGIYTHEQIESWRPIPEAVHARGGRIFLQIFHTGRIALPDFLPEHTQPVAPSAVRAKGQNYTDEGMKEFVTPREITREEIAQTVRDFAAAATNAITAGFDGVELHAASGYIVQQFLTTNANLRSDEYGGSIENRARFLFEVLDAMIAAIGPERVGVKFSPNIPFNDIEEADADVLYPYILEWLNDRNIAYVHVADYTGKVHAKLRAVYQGVYFAGAGFSKESGEALVEQGGADAIVFGTKLLANPDLPERFRRNASLNEPDQSTFYMPGEHGYTDYPTLAAAEASS